MTIGVNCFVQWFLFSFNKNVYRGELSSTIIPQIHSHQRHQITIKTKRKNSRWVTAMGGLPLICAADLQIKFTVHSPGRGMGRF